jgi:hypothetical protein
MRIKAILIISISIIFISGCALKDDVGQNISGLWKIKLAQSSMPGLNAVDGQHADELSSLVAEIDLSQIKVTFFDKISAQSEKIVVPIEVVLEEPDFVVIHVIDKFFSWYVKLELKGAYLLATQVTEPTGRFVMETGNNYLTLERVE